MITDKSHDTSNALIINTRPAQRSQRLTHDLLDDGFDVIEFPLLILQDLPLDTVLLQQYQHLREAHLIIVVSSSAVEIGMRHYQALGLDLAQLRSKSWIAVGKTTQRALQHYGINALTAIIESSEGLLQLPILQHCHHQVVAFWRGIGGRQLLIETLRAQHCHIIDMTLYQRVKPVYSVQHCHNILARAAKVPCWVIISSEFSFKNWYALFAQHLTQFHYLVLGDRVTQLVLDQLPQEKIEVRTLNRLDALTIKTALLHHKA